MIAVVYSYFLLISIVIYKSPAKAENETQPVYFSLIVFGGENGFNSSVAIPAIDEALEEIENQDLLPGYKLTYIRAQNSKVYI